MKLSQCDSHKQLLDTLCHLIYKRKFKEAEKKLLDFIEETLHYSKDSVQITDKKIICQTIYYSFNRFYLNWLKINKIDIEKERKDLISYEHSNYLISHTTKIAEMDDLLFNLIDYLDSDIQKNEVAYGLNCYRKYLSA